MHRLPVRVTMFHCNPTAISVRNRTDAEVVFVRRRGWKGEVFLGMDAKILEMFADRLNFTPVVHGTSDQKLFGYRRNGIYSGTLRDLVTTSQ